MSPEQFIDVTSLIALVLLGLALLLSMVRIVIGPTLADRVLALDLLTVVAMGFIGAVAVRTGISLYLDIAIAVALLGFLATVALARYILSRGARAEEAYRDGGA
ncbi:cation:proton antiporter [Devosia sp. 63-57]|uniref:cation:proton antiporter n=1 Tax=Devosia sp. 63-57 TaxID=1895751 RepID=UPI00086ACE7A|nr:cation:proton antiporter [Devosia sp. 63-57]ODT47421.1 MAG: cation:proton antiporter [Pelagibacterium sp. SCN 63-126]ODU87097.1 MAG: cation:proton antiporter [Pelagibacterium sp. SCN 63-17]OJX42871.1 MAG: cation:proton antiporter [Devosia sp. 63-57]